MVTIQEVSHTHGIDLEKVSCEFDIKWAIDYFEKDKGIEFGPLHRKYLIEKAPSDVRKNLELAQLRPNLIGASSDFTAPEWKRFPPGNLRAPIASTTVETNLYDPNFWARIPAHSMVGGRFYEINFGGVCGTTGTPTIVWRARFGTNNSAPPTGTDLGIGPTMTLGGFSAQPFTGQGFFGVRVAGVAASGLTMTGNGFVIMPGAAAATTVPTCVFGGAVPATLDESIDQGISVSMAWSASSASNTLTPQWMTFRTTA